MTSAKGPVNRGCVEIKVAVPTQLCGGGHKKRRLSIDVLPQQTCSNG